MNCYQAIDDEVGRAVEKGEIAYTEVGQPLEVKGSQRRSGEVRRGQGRSGGEVLVTISGYSTSPFYFGLFTCTQASPVN